MGALEIIVIIACVLIVAFVIVKHFIDKKKGKTCCDCSSCPHNCICRKKEENNKNS